MNDELINLPNETEATNTPTSEGSGNATDEFQVAEELDREIANLQREIDALLNGGEEEPVEAKSPPKKGDLSKAVKEKNRVIKELKEKIRTLNQAMKQPEGQKEQPVAEKPNEEKQVLEVQQRISEINQKCNELEQKYKDAPIPFNRVDVLLEVYRKTGGVVNDLDILEDVYLASLKRKESEISQVSEARKNASTETPSGQGANVEIEPKSLDEAFALLKGKKFG
jgi:DNA repair exonuclease SbcCD ATPase subunit